MHERAKTQQVASERVRERHSFCSVHPLPPTTCSLGWRTGSCVRPGNCVPTREKLDIIAYLSEVAELVTALQGISASINQ